MIWSKMCPAQNTGFSSSIIKGKICAAQNTGFSSFGINSSEYTCESVSVWIGHRLFKTIFFHYLSVFVSLSFSLSFFRSFSLGLSLSLPFSSVRRNVVKSLKCPANASKDRFPPKKMLRRKTWNRLKEKESFYMYRQIRKG